MERGYCKFSAIGLQNANSNEGRRQKQKKEINKEWKDREVGDNRQRHCVVVRLFALF